MSKPTPGPWGVSNSTDVFTHTGAPNAAGIDAAHNDGWHICDCSVGVTFMADGGEAGLDFAEQVANARLIAAAPDLLRAIDHPVLRELFGRLEDGGDDGLWGLCQVWFDIRDAAIQKARGAS